MNKFELDKTMECFGFDKKDCYEICGCKYYHDGRYFTIVNGKTSKELAKLIKSKYDNNKYKIRVEGNHVDYEPTGDVYTYHIDTIEGLVAYLIETKNYYSKTQTNPDELENMLDLIYKKILENVNPQLNIYDWMLDRDNRKEYFKRVLLNNTYLDFKLRKQIELFDSMVNPFANNHCDINNSKFIVRGSGYEEDESWFTLTDKESGIVFSTIRSKDGFVLKLHIPTEVPYEIDVYHYFDKNGEEIAFEKYDESDLTRIEYNLRDETFGEHYGEKHKATTNDKKFVINTLGEYITLARSIVAKNICKKSNDMGTVLKKTRKPEAK